MLFCCFQMMNAKQREAVQMAREGHNVFISGGIGTGKTFTLQSIVNALKNEHPINIAVTASTGLASKQIGVKASTLHSWAGLRDGRYSNDELARLLTNDITFKSSRQRITTTDVLIIDEISMISACIFAQLDFICQYIRKSSKPFGGIQIIACGDFRQLRPVPNESYNDPGHYCFSTEAWKSIPHVINLDQVMRQTDRNFINAIQCLAKGGAMPVKVKELLEHLSRPLLTGRDPVYLFARTWDVDMLNHDKLRQLGPGEKVYTSKQMGTAKCLKTFQAPHHLVLNIHAKVMLVVNLSPNLVNGTMGVIVTMDDGGCVVDFDGVGRITVIPYIFTIYSTERGCDIASRMQLPLKLAYGLTIHKAQGMTLDRVVVDATNTSSPGQLATAVGRAVSMDGLQLINLKIVNGILNVPRHTKAVEDYYENTCFHVVGCQCPGTLKENKLDSANDIDDDTPRQADNDPVDDPFGNDDDDDEDNLQEMLAASDQIATDDVILPPLPLNLDLVDIRKCVRSTFSCSVTPQQQALCDRDSRLSGNVLHAYVNVQLCQLERMYQPITMKATGQVAHRDFCKVMKEYHNYITS